MLILAMELLIQMWLWTMFCVIILPAMIVATIIYLRKLAKRPAPPMRSATAPPVVMRRWTGARRYYADQDKNAWDRDFKEVDRA